MDNWELKPCNDLNRMLKVRTDLDTFTKEEYPVLITIVHRYATSDDMLFPEPSTLAFFSSFEENCLHDLENAIYTAQDINTGLLKIFIYSSKNYTKIIHKTMKFLKDKPEYHIEYFVKKDLHWDFLNTIEE